MKKEFQERGSRQIHSFMWIFNAQNETAYNEFVEKTINPKVPEHLEDPELFVLVQPHSRTY